LGAFSVLAVLALAASPAPAAEGLYSRVLTSFANHNQTVPPCTYSGRQLESVLRSEGPNGGQYDEPFITAIQGAIAARAGGACLSKQTSAVRAPTPGASGASAPTLRGPASPPSPASAHRPIPVLPVTAATGGRLPAPIVLLAALAGLLALLAAVLAAARMRGWDPVWAAGWRHAWSEAGYRFAGTWSELVDRLRSRRAP